MTAELGQLALIIAFIIAITQALVPLYGSYSKERFALHLGKPLAWVQTGFISFAFVSLAYAFLSNDFSIMYVAQNSNQKLPAIYRFCAVWGGRMRDRCSCGC